MGSTILLVGEDRPLLDSRALVLHGTSISTVTTDADGIANLCLEQCDLVVLCHSIRPERLVSVSNDVRRRWPGVRILQIVKSEFEPSRIPHYADGIAASFHPAELIDTAFRLLRSAKRRRPPKVSGAVMSKRLPKSFGPAKSVCNKKASQFEWRAESLNRRMG